MNTVHHIGDGLDSAIRAIASGDTLSKPRFSI